MLAKQLKLTSDQQSKVRRHRASGFALTSTERRCGLDLRQRTESVVETSATSPENKGAIMRATCEITGTSGRHRTVDDIPHPTRADVRRSK